MLWNRPVFTISISNGAIQKYEGDIPGEFLFDVQQLVRMHKIQTLTVKMLNKRGGPQLIFQHDIEPALRLKFEQALSLSPKQR